jgi:hypothetical protein
VRLAILCAVILCAAGTVAVAQPPDVKKGISDGMKRECMIRQRAAQENRNLTNETLTKYCNCVGDHTLDALTISEMQETIKNPIPPAIQRKLNALGEACLAELR